MVTFFLITRLFIFIFLNYMLYANNVRLTQINLLKVTCCWFIRQTLVLQLLNERLAAIWVAVSVLAIAAFIPVITSLICRPCFVVIFKIWEEIIS